MYSDLHACGLQEQRECGNAICRCWCTCRSLWYQQQFSPGQSSAWKAKSYCHGYELPWHWRDMQLDGVARVCAVLLDVLMATYKAGNSLR